MLAPVESAPPPTRPMRNVTLLEEGEKSPILPPRVTSLTLRIVVRARGLSLALFPLRKRMKNSK